MMSIAFKEGLKIPAPAMDQIIVGASQDVRQVKHEEFFLHPTSPPLPPSLLRTLAHHLATPYTNRKYTIVIQRWLEKCASVLSLPG